jgi:HD-GYP domain-containing protein (c-di-GMP phosphodiesterase class II)
MRANNGETQYPYNSRIIEIYLDLVDQRYPYVDKSDLLSYAGMHPYEIADQGHWFSQDQVDRFHERLVQLTGNPNIAREAGRFAAVSQVGSIFRRYIIGLFAPANVFAILEKAGGILTRSTSFSTRKIAPNTVEITVEPNPGMEEKHYQCENRAGFFEAIPMVFNPRPPRLEHDTCMFRGGNRCVYRVSWEDSFSAKLKRFTRFFMIPVVAANVALAVTVPQVARYVMPASVIGAAALVIFSLYRETVDLRRILKEYHRATDELIGQTKTNYNNTLLAYEVGQVTNKFSTAEDVVAEVMDVVQRRLDYDRGMIMLADKEHRRLHYSEGFGYADEHLTLLQSTEFHLDKPESRGAFVQSFRSQKPILVNNVETIEGNLSKRSLEFVRKVATRAFIVCPIVCDGESLGILAVDNLTSKRPLLQSDMSMLMGIASVIGISVKNAALVEAREAQFRSILGALASTIDARDFLTAGHSEKVTEYAVGICEEMGIDREAQDVIRIAALLHDYGKIGVPDRILKKNGQLTVEEHEIIKTHAGKTREILRQINFDGPYREVPAIAGAHHEHVDGNGYPDGLVGDAIPLGARIIAVADFFEAITSKRHYRDPMTLQEAIRLLRQSAGTHLDPQIVEAFIRFATQRFSLPHSPTRQLRPSAFTPQQSTNGV